MNKNMCFIFIQFLRINHTPGLGYNSTMQHHLLWVRTLCVYLSWNWLDYNEAIAFRTTKTTTMYARSLLEYFRLSACSFDCVKISLPSASSFLVFFTFSNSMHDCIHVKQIFEISLHTYAPLPLSCARMLFLTFCKFGYIWHFVHFPPSKMPSEIAWNWVELAVNCAIVHAKYQ